MGSQLRDPYVRYRYDEQRPGGGFAHLRGRIRSDLRVLLHRRSFRRPLETQANDDLVRLFVRRFRVRGAVHADVRLLGSRLFRHIYFGDPLPIFTAVRYEAVQAACSSG
ncbi:hypothetical protein D1872_251140 [compost metagenome]